MRNGQFICNLCERKKKKERMAETEGSFGGVCGVFTTQDDP